MVLVNQNKNPFFKGLKGIEGLTLYPQTTHVKKLKGERKK